MSEQQTFKFKVKPPRHMVERDAKEQIFHVHAEYPYYMYSVILKSTEKMSAPEQYRLAVAELKVKLIRDISNAEFELDENP